MDNRPTLTRSIFCYALLATFLISSNTIAETPVAGRNVNMVSGTTFPGGDPFLQRQNEVSIAVSSRNPQHLFAGTNDYRTVDLPNVADQFLVAPTVADSWLGVYTSYDGGNSWTSTLLPGFPQDASSEGQASPIHGFTTGTDPIVGAGSNGMLYYGGIAFNRDEKQEGSIFVARYIDNNNKEAGENVVYLDTQVVHFGTPGKFVDKPWMVVDVPRQGAGQCTIQTTQIEDGQPVTVTQTFPAGNVYVVFSEFVGQSDINYSSRIMFARSTDCGATWSKLQRITRGSRVYQGATMAIDPINGDVYVAWREIQTVLKKGKKTKVEGVNAIHIAKSTDQGHSFSRPITIAEIDPFDLGTNGCVIECGQFRSRAFPTMAVDDEHRVYLASAERMPGFNQQGRIVVRTSVGGENWMGPYLIEPNPSLTDGHQLMPTLKFASGKLMMGLYDFRDDVALGAGFPSSANPFDLVPPDPAPGVAYDHFQHTIDARVAQAVPADAPVFTSIRASRYRFGLDNAGNPEQLEYNGPNLFLFDQGTKPFIGDYNDIASQNIVFKDGEWKWNTEPSDSAVFHFAWADNRDVVPPPGPEPRDWTQYTAPGSVAGAASLFDPSQTQPGSCNPLTEGMRNQNAYTSRITQGIAVSVPGNDKPLGVFQRAFVVSVKNTTPWDVSPYRFFRLTIEPPPSGTLASFQQFDTVPSILLTIPARSTAARSVYVTSADPDASVRVLVQEVDIAGDPVPDGLAGSAVLNPDILNPDILNPDILNPDILNPDILNAEVHNPDILNTVQVTNILNPDILNPDILNPDILNPDILNPDILNPDILNPDILNPDILNPDILNPDILNPDILNPDILNPDILNPDILNASVPGNVSVQDVIFTVTNNGNTTSVFTFKNFLSEQAEDFAFQLLVYKNHLTPTALNCGQTQSGATVGEKINQELVVNILNPDILNPDILNPDILNPDILNPDILNPDILNAAFPLAPGEIAKVALRVIDLDTTDGEQFTINGAPLPPPDPNTSSTLGVPIEDIQVGDATINAAIIAHDVNSDDAAAGITTPPAATAGLTIVTQELPSGRVGDAYVAPSSVDPVVRLRASGGTPPYAWSLTAGALPAGFTLAPTGEITGTTATAGSYSFTAQVMDDVGNIDQRELVIGIAPAAGIASLVVVSQPNPCTDTANPAPTCVRPEETIIPAVSVKAFDSSSAPASGVVVTLAIGSGPAGAVLDGTNPRTTNASGVAVFNDLTVSRPGVYSLDASASGFAPASTGNFNVIAPDLVVSSLTHAPANPTTLDMMTFTATVENTGIDDAPASTLMFKIGGETPGAPGTLFDVPALDPGESFTVQRMEQLTVAQNYVNTATADFNDAIIEMDETNNTATDNYVVTEPSDLVVDSLTHAPANPTTLDTMTFTATVRNNGVGPAPATTLMFKIGGETPGAPQTLFPVPALGPGDSFTVQRMEQLTVAQGYINTATADFSDAVTESSESNNTTTDSYVVTVAPDLVVDSMTNAPANPSTLDTMTFTATVRNNGVGPAPATTLMFKIGGETTGAPQTLFAVPALGPGASFTAQRMEQLTVAQGYLNTATADFSGAVTESDETNNTTTDSYVVIDPVVSSGSVTIPGTFLFDFDAGVIVNAPSADVFWRQQTPTTRRLEPYLSASIVNLGIVSFAGLSLADLQGLTYGGTPIDGSDTSNVLVPGNVFAVRTNQGNYAKAVVTGPFDATQNNGLVIQWVTYQFP